MRAIHTAVVLGMLALSACSGTPETARAESIEFDAARQHIGETFRVCGNLISSATESDDTFLNVGEDYPSPDRFVMVVWDEPGYEAPNDNSRVCAKGEITEYEGVPQIGVRSGSSIEVLAEAQVTPLSDNTDVADDDTEFALTDVCFALIQQHEQMGMTKAVAEDDYLAWANVIAAAHEHGDDETKASLDAVLAPLNNSLTARNKGEFESAFRDYVDAWSDFVTMCADLPE